jgi:hypothetical protein
MSRGLPTISALDLWHESARTRPGYSENKISEDVISTARSFATAGCRLIRDPQWPARGVRCRRDLSGAYVMTTVNERTPILRRSETDDAPPRTWTRRPLYGAVFCSLLAFGTNSLVLSNGGWCPVQRRRQRESVRTSSSTRADPILVLSSEPGRASLHTDPVFAIAH